MRKLFVVILLFSTYKSAIAMDFNKIKNTLLLTPDYGILSDKDFLNLLFGRDERNIVPITNIGFTNTAYWQCFDSKIIKYKCILGSSKRNTPANFDIAIKLNSHLIYLHTRSVYEEFNWCKDMENSINKIMSNEKYACIAAEYTGKNEYLDEMKQRFGKDIKKQTTWILEKIKTKKGEWSWFINEK